MVSEPRPNRILSTTGLLAGSRVSPLRGSLRWRLAATRFLLLGSVSVDGLRPTDLSGWSSGHRSMLALSGRQAVPHGLSRPRVALHTVRRQRRARLAHL